MSDDQPPHHRRSIRLPGFDYASQGAYFVTIVTDLRRCLFGDIVSEKLRSSRLGEIALEEWLTGPTHRSEIELGPFCLMPNHLHAIVSILTPAQSTEGDPRVAPTRRGPGQRSLGALISGYKAAVTKRYRRDAGDPNANVWQRNYYEHVIRDQEDWYKIEEYILANPRRWSEDAENPSFIAEFGD
jgi:putative transposase